MLRTWLIQNRFHCFDQLCRSLYHFDCWLPHCCCSSDVLTRQLAVYPGWLLHVDVRLSPDVQCPQLMGYTNLWLKYNNCMDCGGLLQEGCQVTHHLAIPATFVSRLCGITDVKLCMGNIHSTCTHFPFVVWLCCIPHLHQLAVIINFGKSAQVNWGASTLFLWALDFTAQLMVVAKLIVNSSGLHIEYLTAVCV